MFVEVLWHFHKLMVHSIELEQNKQLLQLEDMVEHISHVLQHIHALVMVVEWLQEQDYLYKI